MRSLKSKADSYPCDILVLPELIGSNEPTESYQQAICSLAKYWACTIVGGSHYLPLERGLVNSGIVADPKGRVLCSYEKVRPYGSELQRGIISGESVGKFRISGRDCVVLICSDLWFSDSFNALDSNPDLILIPSFSITQRDSPEHARQLWRHMAVSRAYEHAAYVAISDWAYPCRFDGLAAAGVSGLANPRPTEEGAFFLANGDREIHTYHLDLERLDAFRANRADRGFLRHPPSMGALP